MMKAASIGELEFNDKSLGHFLTAKLGPNRGTFQLSRISGGQSNPTYFLNWGEQTHVLRKPPTGPILKGG